MRVIGTAGHVDHGKSTLVQALTGINPDRLKEEREREMTIDLGFAWFTFPDGEEVGIVDVPGHRDFIENMLAGIGGIDAVLLVIAADEGIMPQTREHLAIIDILGIPAGVVALTKIDMIEDQEWLELVEDDIRQYLDPTVLEGVPIVRVSGQSGEGIQQLLEALRACLAENAPRVDYGRPRLPVDRVFSIAGFGTVVTGTLLDGYLHTGDEVVVLPTRGKGRIRGLQSHKKKEEVAVPGSRTAINISGMTVDQIQRGDVVTHPNKYKPTRRMDVSFRLLPSSNLPLKHNTEVKLYIGAVEVVARVRLLGVEQLNPGDEGWLQLEMKQPVVGIRGDRYILRRPSPGETLGGGVVVDPQPKGRHKRFARETIERLSKLAQGTPKDVLLQSMMALKAAPLNHVVANSSLDENVAQKAFIELLESGDIIFLEDVDIEGLSPKSNTFAMSKVYWEQLSGKALWEVGHYHDTFPLRRGMPREELKSRLNISAQLFNVLIEKLHLDGALQKNGPFIFKPNHKIQLDSHQQQAVDDLLQDFVASPYSPPSVKVCQSKVGGEVYTALIDLDMLIQVSPDVVYSKEGYDEMVRQLRELIKKTGSVTAAQVRDHFNTSRRYVLALLEHLDDIGVTVREGDVRRLKN